MVTILSVIIWLRAADSGNNRGVSTYGLYLLK